MADITMCSNILCPQARECKRRCAPQSEWQSCTLFKYTVGDRGVECDAFIPRKGYDYGEQTVDDRVEVAPCT